MRQEIFIELKDNNKMRKTFPLSTLFNIFVILGGGLLTLGVCYLLYLLIYNFVEVQFFPTDPSSLPADIIRRVYTLVLLILYLVLLYTKVSDLFKATLLVGPVGILLTTMILGFYEKPIFAIAALLVTLAACIFLLCRYHKPWFYYFAIAVTVVTAVALAWPRA